MEFGLSTATALPPVTVQPGRDAFGYVLRTCETAQESGFDGIGIGQRYIGGDTHQYLQPLVVAAYIFARFPGMYVSTNVYLLPYVHPVRTAEEVATLDLMAPGRFLFGVGQGYRKDEGAVFQVAGAERARRMVEAISAMKALWQPGARSFAGEFWEFEDVNLSVKPVRPAGPPILLGADTARTIAQVISRGGDFWYSSPRHSRDFLRQAVPVWRRALEEAGRPFPGLALGRNICVAENRKAARALAAEPFGDYMRKQSAWGQPGERYDIDPAELLGERVILGSSEEAAEQILALHEEFGIGYLNLRVYAAGMDQERALDMVRQAGAEVLPIIRAETGRRSMFARWAEQSDDSEKGGIQSA